MSTFNETVNTFQDKQAQYDFAFQSIVQIIEPQLPFTTNAANTVAILKSTFHWWWVGFYFKENNLLVLNVFQGPPACTTIEFTKGVCGAAFSQKETVIVPNVHNFPGHIACSAASKSEIVVPIIKNNECIGVLDIDSVNFNDFDEIDKINLEKICEYVKQFIK